MNKRASMPPELVPFEKLYREPAHADLDAEREETPGFVEYWRAIMLRKWSILALVCAVSGITLLWVSHAVPVYQSSATVLVETDRPKLVPAGDAYGGAGAYYREYFQTQAEILKSRVVAEGAAEKLKLFEHPDFDPRQWKPSAVRTWISEHLPALAGLVWKPARPLDDASVKAMVLEGFAGRLTVEPTRQSQLIKVSFEARDPKLAAAAANATAETYIQSDLDVRYKTVDKTGQLIELHLEDLKEKLQASEVALQAYRDREGMLDNKKTVLGGSGQQLEELTRKLVDARVHRVDAEQAYRQIKAGESTNFDSAPAVVKSPLVAGAREVEARAKNKLAEFSQRYGPDHPNFAAARSELTSAQAVTQRQIQVVVESISKEYKTARATEKTIEGALAQAKGTIQSLNRKEIPLEALERDVATNLHLYQAFLSRSKETSASKDAQVSIARLVDPAVPAEFPIRPAKTRMVAIAAVLAVFFGVMVSLFLKTLNNKVITSGDVEKKLHHPFLAATPVLPRKHRRNFGRYVLDYPRDLYAESVRTVSTGILLSALDIPRKIVVVTSSGQKEGKSTFAMNLAFSQSKSARVLLIEGDMRRPCFGEALKLPPQHKGLSQLLSGTATFDECLTRIDGTNLHVVPAGPIPSNPLELLSSRKFRELLAMLRDRCDMVIIDSPPVQLVSDALVIGSQATGVIFVVKADDTSVRSAAAGLKRIAAAHIPVFGVVLNQQDFKKAERYYGESAGYGSYGYGAPSGRSGKLSRLLLPPGRRT